MIHFSKNRFVATIANNRRSQSASLALLLQTLESRQMLSGVAVDDSYVSVAGMQEFFHVLDNDTHGEPVEIVSHTNPAFGQLELLEPDEGPAWFKFRSWQSEVGATSFTYTVENALGEQTTATVTIQLADPNADLVFDSTIAFDQVTIDGTAHSGSLLEVARPVVNGVVTTPGETQSGWIDIRAADIYTEIATTSGSPFTFDLRTLGLMPGTHTLSMRFRGTDPDTQEGTRSSWVQYELDYDSTTLSPYTITSFAPTPTDELQLTGVLNGGAFEPGAVQLQYDLNADGTVDGVTVVEDTTTGQFTVDLGHLDLPDGPVAVAVRASSWSETEEMVVTSDWAFTTLSVALQTTPPVGIISVTAQGMASGGASVSGELTAPPSDRIRLQYDFDSDGRAETSSAPAVDGHFHIDLGAHTFAPGAQTVAVRVAEYDEWGGVRYGDWVTVSLTIPSEAEQSLSFGTLQIPPYGPGESTGIPHVTGTVLSDGTPIGDVQVEVDTDADGVGDLLVHTNELGEFRASLISLFGSETDQAIRLRIVADSISDWTEMVFTGSPVTLTAPLVETVDVLAAELDGDGAWLRGRLVEGEHSLAIRVDYDFDGDGNVDGETSASRNTGEFYWQLPTGALVAGTNTIWLRTRIGSEDRPGGEAIGNWQALTFEYVPLTPPQPAPDGGTGEEPSDESYGGDSYGGDPYGGDYYQEEYYEDPYGGSGYGEEAPPYWEDPGYGEEGGGENYVYADVHSLALKDDADGDGVTTSPVITGAVSVTGSGQGFLVVEYDTDGDWMSDGSVLVDDPTGGTFEADLSHLIVRAGSQSVTFWANFQSSESGENSLAYGGQTISFEFQLPSQEEWDVSYTAPDALTDDQEIAPGEDLFRDGEFHVQTWLPEQGAIASFDLNNDLSVHDQIPGWVPTASFSDSDSVTTTDTETLSDGNGGIITVTTTVTETWTINRVVDANGWTVHETWVIDYYVVTDSDAQTLSQSGTISTVFDASGDASRIDYEYDLSREDWFTANRDGISEGMLLDVALDEEIALSGQGHQAIGFDSEGWFLLDGTGNISDDDESYSVSAGGVVTWLAGTTADPLDPTLSPVPLRNERTWSDTLAVSETLVTYQGADTQLTESWTDRETSDYDERIHRLSDETIEVDAEQVIGSSGVTQEFVQRTTGWTGSKIERVANDGTETGQHWTSESIDEQMRNRTDTGSWESRSLSDQTSRDRTWQFSESPTTSSEGSIEVRKEYEREATNHTIAASHTDSNGLDEGGTSSTTIDREERNTWTETTHSESRSVQDGALTYDVQFSLTENAHELLIDESYSNYSVGDLTGFNIQSLRTPLPGEDSSLGPQWFRIEGSDILQNVSATHHVDVTTVDWTSNSSVQTSGTEVGDGLSGSYLGQETIDETGRVQTRYASSRITDIDGNFVSVGDIGSSGFNLPGNLDHFYLYTDVHREWGLTLQHNLTATSSPQEGYSQTATTNESFTDLGSSSDTSREEQWWTPDSTEVVETWSESSHSRDMSGIIVSNDKQSLSRTSAFVDDAGGSHTGQESASASGLQTTSYEWSSAGAYSTDKSGTTSGAKTVREHYQGQFTANDLSNASFTSSFSGTAGSSEVSSQTFSKNDASGNFSSTSERTFTLLSDGTESISGSDLGMSMTTGFFEITQSSSATGTDIQNGEGTYQFVAFSGNFSSEDKGHFTHTTNLQATIANGEVFSSNDRSDYNLEGKRTYSSSSDSSYTRQTGSDIQNSGEDDYSDPDALSVSGFSMTVVDGSRSTSSGGTDTYSRELNSLDEVRIDGSLHSTLTDLFTLSGSGSFSETENETITSSSLSQGINNGRIQSSNSFLSTSLNSATNGTFAHTVSLSDSTVDGVNTGLDSLSSERESTTSYDRTTESHSTSNFKFQNSDQGLEESSSSSLESQSFETGTEEFSSSSNSTTERFGDGSTHAERFSQYSQTGQGSTGTSSSGEGESSQQQNRMRGDREVIGYSSSQSNAEGTYTSEATGEFETINKVSTSATSHSRTDVGTGSGTADSVRIGWLNTRQGGTRSEFRMTSSDSTSTTQYTSTEGGWTTGAADGTQSSKSFYSQNDSGTFTNNSESSLSSTFTYTDADEELVSPESKNDPTPTGTSGISATPVDEPGWGFDDGFWGEGPEWMPDPVLTGTSDEGGDGSSTDNSGASSHFHIDHKSTRDEESTSTQTGTNFLVASGWILNVGDVQTESHQGTETHETGPGGNTSVRTASQSSSTTVSAAASTGKTNSGSTSIASEAGTSSETTFWSTTVTDGVRSEVTKYDSNEDGKSSYESTSWGTRDSKVVITPEQPLPEVSDQAGGLTISALGAEPFDVADDHSDGAGKRFSGIVFTTSMEFGDRSGEGTYSRSSKSEVSRTGGTTNTVREATNTESSFGTESSGATSSTTMTGTVSYAGYSEGGANRTEVTKVSSGGSRISSSEGGYSTFSDAKSKGTNDSTTITKEEQYDRWGDEVSSTTANASSRTDDINRTLSGSGESSTDEETPTTYRTGHESSSEFSTLDEARTFSESVHVLTMKADDTETVETEVWSDTPSSSTVWTQTSSSHADYTDHIGDRGTRTSQQTTSGTGEGTSSGSSSDHVKTIDGDIVAFDWSSSSEHFSTATRTGSGSSSVDLDYFDQGIQRRETGGGSQEEFSITKSSGSGSGSGSKTEQGEETWSESFNETSTTDFKHIENSNWGNKADGSQGGIYVINESDGFSSKKTTGTVTVTTDGTGSLGSSGGTKTIVRTTTESGTVSSIENGNSKTAERETKKDHDRGAVSVGKGVSQSETTNSLKVVNLGYSASVEETETIPDDDTSAGEGTTSSVEWGNSNYSSSETSFTETTKGNVRTETTHGDDGTRTVNYTDESKVSSTNTTTSDQANVTLAKDGSRDESGTHSSDSVTVKGWRITTGYNSYLTESFGSGDDIVVVKVDRGENTSTGGGGASRSASSYNYTQEDEGSQIRSDETSISQKGKQDHSGKTGYRTIRVGDEVYLESKSQSTTTTTALEGTQTHSDGTSSPLDTNNRTTNSTDNVTVDLTVEGVPFKYWENWGVFYFGGSGPIARGWTGMDEAEYSSKTTTTSSETENWDGSTGTEETTYNSETVRKLTWSHVNDPDISIEQGEYTAPGETESQTVDLYKHTSWSEERGEYEETQTTDNKTVYDLVSLFEYEGPSPQEGYGFAKAVAVVKSVNNTESVEVTGDEAMANGGETEHIPEGRLDSSWESFTGNGYEESYSFSEGIDSDTGDGFYIFDESTTTRALNLVKGSDVDPQTGELTEWGDDFDARALLDDWQGHEDVHEVVSSSNWTDSGTGVYEPFYWSPSIAATNNVKPNFQLDSLSQRMSDGLYRGSDGTGSPIRWVINTTAEGLREAYGDEFLLNHGDWTIVGATAGIMIGSGIAGSVVAGAAGLSGLSAAIVIGAVDGGLSVAAMNLAGHGEVQWDQVAVGAAGGALFGGVFHGAGALGKGLFRAAGGPKVGQAIGRTKFGKVMTVNVREIGPRVKCRWKNGEWGQCFVPETPVATHWTLHGPTEMASTSFSEVEVSTTTLPRWLQVTMVSVGVWGAASLLLLGKSRSASGSRRRTSVTPLQLVFDPRSGQWLSAH